MLKYLNFDKIMEFFYCLCFKFFIREVKSIFKDFKYFIYKFIFIKEWTFLRIFSLIIGWSFWVAPFLLFIAILYRVIIIFNLRLIIFIIDYFLLYRGYALGKTYEKSSKYSFVNKYNRSFVKVNYLHSNEVKKMYTSLENLSCKRKHNFNLLSKVVQTNLNILRKSLITIPADDLYKIFSNITKNNNNHYQDNFNEIFLLYAVNWQNWFYAKYIVKRENFSRIFNDLIPFWFFYIFTWKCWKRFFKWIFIDTIMSVIAATDRGVYSILKRIEYFVIYTIPRLVSLFMYKIYYPLDDLRERFEFLVLHIFLHKWLYFDMVKWHLWGFFRYKLKRIPKRIFKKMRFGVKKIYFYSKMALKWKIKQLIYYTLTISIFIFSPVLILIQIFFNILKWIICWIIWFLKQAFYWRFWLKYMRTILSFKIWKIKWYCYNKVLPILYRMLNKFNRLKYFISLIIYYLKLIFYKIMFYYSYYIKSLVLKIWIIFKKIMLKLKVILILFSKIRINFFFIIFYFVKFLIKRLKIRLLILIKKFIFLLKLQFLTFKQNKIKKFIFLLKLRFLIFKQNKIKDIIKIIFFVFPLKLWASRKRLIWVAWLLYWLYKVVKFLIY